jgi:hypothetical protein
MGHPWAGGPPSHAVTLKPIIYLLIKLFNNI